MQCVVNAETCTEYEDKAMFVELYINMLLKKMDKRIKKVRYRADLKAGKVLREIVSIYFENSPISRNVDVTCDSKRAIIEDVLKCI